MNCSSVATIGFVVSLPTCPNIVMVCTTISAIDLAKHSSEDNLANKSMSTICKRLCFLEVPCGIDYQGSFKNLRYIFSSGKELPKFLAISYSPTLLLLQSGNIVSRIIIPTKIISSISSSARSGIFSQVRDIINGKMLSRRIKVFVGNLYGCLTNFGRHCLIDYQFVSTDADIWNLEHLEGRVAIE